jgi:hypothetical protein
MSTEPDYELVERCKSRLHRLPEAYLADFEALVEYVEYLENENDILIGEIERLSPPSDGPVDPIVERALAKFYKRVAELRAERAQEDDGELS